MARTKQGETFNIKLRDGFVAYRVDDVFDEKQQVYKAIPTIYKEYKRVLNLNEEQLDDKLVSPSGAYSIRDKKGHLVGALFYDEGYLRGFWASSKEVVPAMMEFCENREDQVNSYVLRHATIGKKTGFHVRDLCELLGAAVVSRQGRHIDRNHLK